MDDDMTGPDGSDLLGSTAEIVAAYVGQNQIMQGDLRPSSAPSMTP